MFRPFWDTFIGYIWGRSKQFFCVWALLNISLAVTLSTSLYRSLDLESCNTFVRFFGTLFGSYFSSFFLVHIFSSLAVPLSISLLPGSEQLVLQTWACSGFSPEDRDLDKRTLVVCISLYRNTQGEFQFRETGWISLYKNTPGVFCLKENPPGEFRCRGTLLSIRRLRQLPLSLLSQCCTAGENKIQVKS